MLLLFSRNKTKYPASPFDRKCRVFSMQSSNKYALSEGLLLQYLHLLLRTVLTLYYNNMHTSVQR